jgi:hypothetical protein
VTEHGDGSRTDRKAIARELASGEVRRAKAKAAKGKVNFTVQTPDPKAWRTLPAKPASEIVKNLGLTDFLLVIGWQRRDVTAASADPEPDITTYQVFGFRRDDHGGKVCTLVDVPRGDPTSPTIIAGNLFGDAEYCFHASMNVTASIHVPDDAKNKLFHGDDELYAAVPALRPPERSRKMRGAVSR